MKDPKLNFKAAFTLKRILAELLAKVNYPCFQGYYWNLRSTDLQKRYNYATDFDTLAALIRKAGVSTVLDVGCGAGRLFPVYAGAGVREVVAVELSKPLFAAADSVAAALQTRSGTRFRLHCSDLRDERLDLGPAELIVSSRVLQHIHPESIELVVEKLFAAQPSHLYLNETSVRADLMRHVFVHDYESILSRRGFHVVERGEIAGVNYEYLFFSKKY